MANIKDATYNLKPIPEGSWYSLQSAVGTALIAIFTVVLNMEPVQAGILALGIAGLIRPVVGLFLPSPPTTGTQADKST